MQSNHRLSNMGLPRKVQNLILQVFPLEVQPRSIRILPKTLACHYFSSLFKNSYNVIRRSLWKFPKLFIDFLQELLMSEIARGHNNNILSNVVFLMILNNHIPVDIINIVYASQNWKSHNMISIGGKTIIMNFTERILLKFPTTFSKFRSTL